MLPEPNSDGGSRSFAGQKLSPIFGLPMDEPVVVPVRTKEEGEAALRLSVIVPARNEEQSLPACLASLLAQADEFFPLDHDWELIVVDDDSKDRTRAIATEAATQHAGVRVIEAPPLELRATQRAFTGKTNACWAAAQQARGRWLLFTDADTVHESGDLVRALHEAEKHQVALLSYSPQQIVQGFWQRALMPLVFSELASVYPLDQVNDPDKRIAAANGQFLMVEREAYFAVGGHRVVGRSVLEDVDLAYSIKRSKRGLRFRYAPDALSTRMYRGLSDMVEGWTKNLVLLFPHALALAAWRLLDLALLLLPLLIFALSYLVLWQKIAILLLWARTLLRYSRRVARSNFSFLNCSLSVFALPLFIVLLVRSWMKHKLFHQVTWKGREYRTGR
ncbi:glycosyltransferase [Granulicella mallensis]|uniref:Glycosyl transferase family 2 n=1 Tax=Granulicella mallensis (strain ATCC BAA-1857 / DSM 23137 / MP5ACTX8) TaxID=682795 RepID=G8NYE1_GRAMM|nr:glycosyltransferase family 2 protein [Granulicella mallensis]AEU37907.1 glycosyl transferase family 2 [Granulicella mallensis MP5ACTX8]